MRHPCISRLLLLLLVAGVWPLAAEPGADDPLSARVFEVRYRDLADAADLVGPLLSEQGALTLRPRLDLLVIEDRISVLDRVEALLQSFDLPPRNVEVTLILFLGTDRRAAADATRSPDSVFSKQVRGVIDALGDFTKWVSYEPLGSGSVTGNEGDRMVADLSPEYRVVLTLESVTAREGQSFVKFRRVDLQRLETDAQGVNRAQQLYSTSAVLQAGTLTVVGAAKRPDSDQALFLMMQVEPQ